MLKGSVAGVALIAGVATTRCSSTPIVLPYGVPPPEAGYPDYQQPDRGEPETGVDLAVDSSVDADAGANDSAAEGGADAADDGAMDR